MIIDCFTFNNEFDLLECRLEYLCRYVDYFLIVEGNITFSGNSKQLQYPTQIDRFRQYQDKILYFPASIATAGLDFTKEINTFDASSAPWAVEKFQRNYIATGLSLFRDNDVVIIGDVDEVPSIDAIFAASKALSTVNIVACKQQMFYYNFDYIQETPWYGSTFTKVGTAKQLTPDGVRACRNNTSMIVPGGGWHLSNWMSPSEIITKIKSFSHQEFNNPKYTDLQTVINHIKSGKDYLGRESNRFIPFDVNSLPPDFISIFSKVTRSRDNLTEVVSN